MTRNEFIKQLVEDPENPGELLLDLGEDSDVQHIKGSFGRKRYPLPQQLPQLNFLNNPCHKIFVYNSVDYM
jgi:hypothetical protein